MAFALLLISFALQAKEVPPKPDPPKLVNDYAEVLSEQEREALEQKLVAFDDSTSNQIAIVIEKTLDGDEAASYAQRIGESWGVGRKENNGVVIYCAIDDRKMAIEVGYGLEPVITDAATYHIRQIMVEPFRAKQYYQGLDKATDVLMKLASGEFKSSQYSKNKQPTGPKLSMTTIIIIIIIFIIIMNIFKKMGGGRKRRRGFDAFTGGFGPFMGGGFGGFGGGGGGFGGGGGGFGGFGGGSFGGGGSSGSW